MTLTGARAAFTIGSMFKAALCWWRDFRDMMHGLARMREYKLPERILEHAWQPLHPERSLALQLERSGQMVDRLVAMAAAYAPRVVRMPPATFVRAKDRDDLGPFRS